MNATGLINIDNIIDTQKISQFETKTKNFVETVIDNKYVHTLIIIFIALYGHNAAPPLSEYFKKLFESF